jgi:hypothetical protein
MFDATTAKITEHWIKNHMGLIDSIIGAESGGDPNAVNPRSSASGAGQFIDSTWLDTIKAARPDLAQGKSDQELLALKTDPDLSRQMTEAYAAQNGAILSKAGHPVTPGNTYLAHFAGPQGAVSVLSADPSTPVGQILRPDAMKANPFLQGMTAGDLRAWADRKMGGSQPVPASPTAPANAPVQLAGGLLTPAQEAASSNGFRTMNIGGYDMPQLGTTRDYAPRLPPQAPPIFAPQPPQTPQQQSQAEPAPLEQIPPMQMPPIFTTPRRSPDLSKLRAAFGQAPIFRRG